MADNVAVTAGSGTAIAADEISDGTLGSCKVQFVKLMDGTIDGTAKAAVSAAGLKVDLGADNDVTVTSGTITAVTAISNALPAGTNNIGDVDVLSSALPTGAATSANQSTIIGHIDGVEGILTTIDGDTGNISTKIDTVAGAVSGTEMQVDVLTLPAITGSVTANAGTNLNTSALALESGGNLAAAATSLSVLDDWDSSDACKVVGPAAHDAAVSGNPVLAAGEARDTLGTAVATGDVVRMAANRYGAQLITAMPPTHASSNGTPIAATTTSVIAAPSAGSHLRVVRAHISNGGATATWVAIRDGAAGTQHYRTYLLQGSAISINLNYSGPLDLTSATRLDIVLSAAGSVEYEIDYLTVAD